jgi:hypothetical protein
VVVEDKIKLTMGFYMLDMFMFIFWEILKDKFYLEATPSFHTLNGMQIGGEVDPHMKATCMFEKMAKYYQ